ncbi:MAG TPA: acetylglutamate kinase [Terriglobales bacterium]|nr:acetylglutamate kinase [Terriglobales bacterium]
MKIVIKIGGAALDDKSVMRNCAWAVTQLVQDGHLVAVVHGGGKLLTRTLDLLGKKTEFIDGLRVTDAETRDVAVMVLAGSVNKNLVAALNSAGACAVGLCGGDGTSFRARKKHFAARDLGYVGEISAVESRWIEAIWSQRGVPVLSSLALGSDGEYYNINADQMAAACAIACKADALIFLTDVPGVTSADGSVIRWLETSRIPALVETSVVAGGMLPKLEACNNALKRGVPRVRIFPAAQAGTLPEFYFSPLHTGTEVIVA